MDSSGIEEEYDSSQSKLLEEFMCIPNIDKAWIFKSDSGSQAMFAMSQANLLANKRRKFLLSTHISKESRESVKFHWSPFPVEMNGVSAFVPSPSGLKLLVVRNSENVESPTQFEIWSWGQLEKEFHITQKVHGSVYVDGWFEGISWNSDETHVAYVAEEPLQSKPTFNHLGYKKKSPLVMIVEAGKVKEIGKRTREKHMLEKGSLRCLLSILTVGKSNLSKEFQDL